VDSVSARAVHRCEHPVEAIAFAAEAEEVQPVLPHIPERYAAAIDLALGPGFAVPSMNPARSQQSRQTKHLVSSASV